MKLNRTGGKYHPLFSSDGKLNDKLRKSITDSLGESDKTIETNGEDIARRYKKISELQDQLEKTSDEHMRDNLNQTIAEEQDAINQLERANEVIEERMTLRDRVKAISKNMGSPYLLWHQL